MRYGVYIDVGVAVAAGHQFLDDVVVLAAVPVGLGLFDGMHLMGAHAAAAANRLHKHREGNPAVGKSGLKLIPVVECQRGTDAFLCQVFEQLVFVEAVDCALRCRAQWNDPGLFKALGICGKYLDFGVNKGRDGLDAVLAADIEYGVDVSWVGDAGNHVLAVAELKRRGGRLVVGTDQKTGLADGFLNVAQQTPTASDAAE